MISFKDKINQVGIHAKEASKILAKIPTKQKNEALPRYNCLLGPSSSTVLQA